jgi:hypothetical protein
MARPISCAYCGMWAEDPASADYTVTPKGQLLCPSCVDSFAGMARNVVGWTSESGVEIDLEPGSERWRHFNLPPRGAAPPRSFEP